LQSAAIIDTASTKSIVFYPQTFLVTSHQLLTIAGMSLLKVERLSKTFGTIRAVDSVSFEVRPGEIYGLLGPNGAGKTTCISMISGLLKPDAGEVFVAGAAFWSDPQKAKRIMGVVPQELAIYEELSGRENLEFWGRMAGLSSRDARSRAAELLAALTLTDRAKDAVKTYSGGMKRRINLGCALLHHPKLLLLDEPTVGVWGGMNFLAARFFQS
jgi:ABC-2 type transport system ATP-binding protein